MNEGGQFQVDAGGAIWLLGVAALAFAVVGRVVQTATNIGQRIAPPIDYHLARGGFTGSKSVLAIVAASLLAPWSAYGQTRVGSINSDGDPPLRPSAPVEQHDGAPSTDQTDSAMAPRPTSATDWKTACAPFPRSSALTEEHVRFEHCLRTFRFRRLAENQGVQAPSIEPLVLPAAESPVDYAVPTLRLAWDNHTFFDTADDTLLEQITPVVDLVALALKRDIGDTNLYVVGHTDSRGNATYNEGLSRRRARSVVERLADAGIPHRQVHYTGMGERQPAASNRTEEGRSLNRRVEFLISAYKEANVALVRTRAVNETWLDNHETFVAIVTPVEVFSLEEGAAPEVFELPPPISHSTYMARLGR